MKNSIKRNLIKLLLLLSGSKIIQNFEKIQKLNSEITQIDTFQNKSLEELLHHSWKNVPYYKNVLEKAKVVDSNGNVSLKNFQNIPILTKDIIRKQGNNLYSNDYKLRKPYSNTSSGSTGDPVSFIQDKQYLDWNIANKLYIKHIYGHDIGDPEIRLWGSEVDILKNNETLIERVKNFLYSRTDFNTFTISETKFEEIMNFWIKHKPNWIEGYVNSLEEFAKYLNEKKISVPQVKGIVSTAGSLDSITKQLLSDTFKSPIINRYGSREAGDMAFSTPENDELLISKWTHKLEIMPSENINNNKTGNIIITSLHNFSMPLIRYEIGDVATKSKKEDRIKRIEGRISSYFLKRNNERIHGGLLRYILYDIKWINKYQIIQKSIDDIEYKIVVNHGQAKSQADLDLVEKKVKKIMGEKCRVIFKFVSHIKPTSSGKFLFTINEIIQ